MKINKDTTTSTLSKSFASSFPYLKLVFYKKPHKQFHGSQQKDEIIEEVTLESLNPKLKEGVVEWKGEMSVDNLETYLEETFGLHVQVFRKAGKIWLQTSVTDHWTLEEQNSKGAEDEKMVTR